MTVKVLEDKDKWDGFVDKSQYGMLFHKWDFLKIAEKHTGYTLYPYGFYKGEELIAVFPAFIKKYMGVGMVYSPPPRCDIPYLGLVPGHQFGSIKQGKKEAHLSFIVEELEAELARHSARIAHFWLAPAITDIRPFLWAGYEHAIRFTYMLDLNRPLEDIWDDLGARTKQCIKTETFSIEQSSDVDLFYRIMSERYSQQNIKASNYLLSKKYLEDLLQAYPENLKMHLARRDGQVANAWVDYMYKGRRIEWIGGVNLQKDSHSNEFMRWEFIRQAKARGYDTYEIYGADIRRLCPGKIKFNPSLSCSYGVSKRTFAGSMASSLYQAGSKLKILP
jgi:hypothetical protein